MTIPDITFYHGNEEWVLKGIAVDFQRSFDSLNLTTSRLESFTKARPASKYHFFVQQGQLLHHCNALGEDALNSTICLFTHLDIANFRKKQLNDCKLLVFMSSLQFSNAVSNGINPSKCLVSPHGVDPSLHRIVNPIDPIYKDFSSPFLPKFDLCSRPFVLFGGRYWEKSTYVSRKNYPLVKRVTTDLLKHNIPIIFLGPGWDRYIKPNPLISFVTTPYKNYPFYYNISRLTLSLSLHEGGPLPLLEGMRCGTSTLATNTGFALDVAHPRHSKVIPGSFSYQQLFSEILSLYSNYDLHAAPLISKHAEKFSFNSTAMRISKQLNLI